MKKKTDSPGVFIPPPIIYLLIFLSSFLLQRALPIKLSVSYYLTLSVGIICIISSIAVLIAAIGLFIKSKNTLITIRPANSLQTAGIYSFTRNPMYLGLMLLYTGIAMIIVNWWALILLPELVLIVTYFIIKPEERYLERSFGLLYLQYKREVRQWI